MTVKIMVLARKKDGLSDEEFRAYYRERHLPFMHDLLDYGAAFHRRNFVVQSDPDNRLDFDVVTEAIYEDEGILQRTVEELAEPIKKRLRQEDEARFLDPESVRIFRVETEETSFRNREEKR